MGKRKAVTALVTSVLITAGCVQPLTLTAAGEGYTLPAVEDGAKAVIESYASLQERLAAMTLVSEDDDACLYYDVLTAQVGLENKADGQIWLSSPYNLADANADDDIKEQIASPVRLTYLNSSLQECEYNSFADAAAKGQITSELIDGGVAAQLVIGEVNQEQLLPAAIPASSFESLLSKVPSSAARRIKANYMEYDLANYSDESIRSELLSKYPGLEQGVVYVLKDVTNTVAKELETYFKSTDYTYEQMAVDENAVFGDAGKQDEEDEAAKACFTMRLEYTLENGQLVVRLPADSIQYDTENFTLEDIYLMEYFGAAKSGDSGYLMLPDGSGTIIDFNQNSVNTGVVIQSEVYGPDAALNFDRANYTKMQMRIPVYGAKVNDSAFLSVIEECDGQSEIYGVVQEGESGYSKAGALFHIHASDEFMYNETDGSGDTSSAYNRVDTNTYSGNLALRIIPLAGQQADYSGMAVAYRNYLIERGVLTEESGTTSLPVYYGALGAVDHEDYFWMFPVTRSVSLTSYSDMISIAEELKAGGIGNLNIRYIGWANGGLRHTVFNRAKLMSSLGGKEGYESLVEYTKVNDIGLFPDVDLAYSRYDTWLDGYSVNKDTARQLDDTYARKYSIDYGSNMEDFDNPELAVKPIVMQEYLSNFLKAYKYTSNGLSLSDLGSDLHADYADNNGVNRSQSGQIIAQMLQSAASSYELMVDGGNAYIYAYVDHILELASTSSGYVQSTASIPFMQMVLHGYIQYAGEPINLSSDTKKATLKAIENGEALYFVLAAENYQVLVDTEFADYFSVDYATWKDRILEIYSQVDSILAGTYNATIDKHEILAGDVVKITYSNGCSIVVNYRDTAYEVDGQTVPAEDALVLSAS